METRGATIRQPSGRPPKSDSAGRARFPLGGTLENTGAGSAKSVPKVTCARDQRVNRDGSWRRLLRRAGNGPCRRGRSRGEAAERDSSGCGWDRQREYARSSHRNEHLEFHHGIAGKSGDTDGRAHVAAGFAEDFNE